MYLWISIYCVCNVLFWLCGIGLLVIYNIYFNFNIFLMIVYKIDVLSRKKI